MLQYAFSWCKSNLNMIHFWKLSGRYKLNHRFNIENWRNFESNGFFKDGVMCSILFKVIYNDFDEFTTFLHSNELQLKNGISMEQICKESCLFKPVQSLGVEGNVSVDGYFISF